MLFKACEDIDPNPIKLINGWFYLEGMKKALFLIVLVLFLVACMGFKQGAYSFEEGFSYIKALDDKYGGDFKAERMEANQVGLKRVDGFEADLSAFSEQVSKDPDSLDKEKLLSFVEARKQMLESERLYQLAVGMGDFKSPELRLCDKKKGMEYAYKYYKAAIGKGVNASNILDEVLQDFEVGQRLIGVNQWQNRVVDDKRPLFYSSQWEETNELLNALGTSLNGCLAKEQ